MIRFRFGETVVIRVTCKASLKTEPGLIVANAIGVVATLSTHHTQRPRSRKEALELLLHCNRAPQPNVWPFLSRLIQATKDSHDHHSLRRRIERFCLEFEANHLPAASPHTKTGWLNLLRQHFPQHTFSATTLADVL